jgi:glycolate oxidase FAD binding subunit
VAGIATREPVEAYYDWGGGLIWLMAPPLDDACASTVRDVVAGRGHAALIRVPDAVRVAQPVFQPQPPPLATLTKRVKEAFDPKLILNPGRLYAGV